MTFGRLGSALLAAFALSCATARPQHVGGGSPPLDARGVPVGGDAAAFPNPAVPNFYSATSVGAPGSGAFAGSGPGKIEWQRSQWTVAPPPETIPEVAPPPRGVGVVPPPAQALDPREGPVTDPLAPLAPSATPVDAPPATPETPPPPIWGP
jgi:hypothetical protein